MPSIQDCTVVSSSSSSTSSASDSAVELLGCFDEGLDRVVYQIAEEKARERGAVVAGVVQVETQDVKNAGDLFFQGIVELISSGKLPQQLASAVQSMKKCFDTKAAGL